VRVLKRLVLTALGILAIVLPVILGVWVLQNRGQNATLGGSLDRSQDRSRVQVNNGGRPRTGEPMQVAEGYSVGGPFTLIDHDGVEVTDEQFRGAFMLIFFGYTFCPDVCPDELANMAATVTELEALDPAKAARLTPVFVTVDPARDTPRAMAEYVRLFHPRMVGLTGSEVQIEAVAGAYKVFYALGENIGEGHYLVDHSAFSYLMGPDGEFIAVFGQRVEPQGAARSIARLMDDYDG
jgi:protein SCO1/2